MNLLPLLSSFGLAETEAQVYLKILEIGQAEASAIAEQTGIKRPTVYHALETLVEKGLVHSAGSTRVARYRAAPPEQLKTIAERKRDELARLEKKIDKFLPFFPTSSETQLTPHVEFYKGREGIMNLAEQVAQNNEEKKLYAIIPDIKDLRLSLTEEFMARFLDLKKVAGVATYSIWDTLLDDDYYNQHHLFNREVRLAPPAMRGKYKSIILIWDKKVATLSLLPELYGLLVTSFDYSATMKVIWQTLWEISQPV